jgi:hypothetical protein
MSGTVTFKFEEGLCACKKGKALDEIRNIKGVFNITVAQKKPDVIYNVEMSDKNKSAHIGKLVSSIENVKEVAITPDEWYKLSGKNRPS